jgi:hypothetical protein
MIDLRNTIAPKSDQLNADDLIGTTKTIRVTKVSLCAEPDQPIAVSFEGDNGKPFKPCKSMRRLLVSVWGPDGASYAGRSMTLFRDDKVRFGGADVGGIRISHLSHIEKPVVVALTVTKSVRKPFKVLPLAIESDAGHDLDAVLSAIASAETLTDLKATAPLAAKLADPAAKAAARQAYSAHKAALEQPTTDPQGDAPTDEAPKPDGAAWILAGITSAQTADLIDDWQEEARHADLTDDERAQIDQAAESRRAELTGG